MDTIVEGPADDGAQDLNLVDATEWVTQDSQGIVNNTFLYIAVEYVKDEFKLDQAQAGGLVPPGESDTFTNFDQHVSPLDPNMSSVARYSPVYSEPSTEFNPIVIHQLVQPDSSNQNELINLTPNSPLPVLCNSDIREVENQFLHMTPPEDPQITADQSQAVELLITDQETGISYNVVSSQEFLVERCLEDEQLLNALTPNPLLESDLLTLDDNTLKTELNDDIINSSVDSAAVNNYISSLGVDLKNSIVDTSDNTTNNYKLRNRNNDAVFDDQMLARVYNIVDKPVLSRARASLPESYLVINKIGDVCGVFAKKIIPKWTQFGPLTGVFVPNVSKINKDEGNSLLYLIEDEFGTINQIDVSDENVSNWMSFVRRAGSFKEENLTMSQEGNDLFFTTTRNILPKEELKVGYSLTYAKHFNLSTLQPSEDDKEYKCFICPKAFLQSDELQQHLNVHDEKNENPRKKLLKSLNNIKQKIVKNNETFKCNNCEEIFHHPGRLTLRNHLIEKHSVSRSDSNFQDYFTSVVSCKCNNCDCVFINEALLKIHNYLHESDNSEEQANHICPGCQKKFPTQRQLVAHVSTHSVTSKPQPVPFKCLVCHKLFSQSDRLRRHMLVHGSEESKPLQCKTCHKRFLNSSALAGHLKTHYVGKKVFECPICKERFDHVLKLKLHVPKHCENNSYSCPHCSKVFKKYSIVRKHIRAFHCDQKHSCPQCSKLFPTLDKLKMHLLRHSDHREFLCADCGKQFKRKDKLMEHCKRMHSEERENDAPKPPKASVAKPKKKLSPRAEPTDFHRFIYKCHTCLVGFKRRGMLVNHLAKRHPDIPPDSVPELNLPILQTTRDYYCQHCDKVYKSSSKRKAHILKNHPGAALPMSNRKQGTFPAEGGGTAAALPNPTYSQTVGSITTRPQSCTWCHKQYASKAKLLQHQRKKHISEMAIEKALSGEKDDDPLSDEHNNDPTENADQDKICIQDDFKVSDDDILNGALEEYANERGGKEQFCHLVAIAESEGFGQNNDDLEGANSHLYRLLTTASSDMVPPR